MDYAEYPVPDRIYQLHNYHCIDQHTEQTPTHHCIWNVFRYHPPTIRHLFAKRILQQNDQQNLSFLEIQ